MELDPANAEMVQLLYLVWPALDCKTARQLKQACRGFQALDIKQLSCLDYICGIPEHRVFRDAENAWLEIWRELTIPSTFKESWAGMRFSE
jgi:hypothetical protein